MEGMDGSTESINPDDALLLSADAARIVLESGGETYRAEDAAVNFATALGGAEAECFATPTGVTFSFAAADGRIHSIVRRIKRRSMHLERIALVDELARDLAAGRADYRSASDRLESIERRPESPVALSVGAAAAGAGFFTLLFGGAWNDALVAAAGALVTRLPPAMARRKLPDFFSNIVAGAAATLLSLFAGSLGLAADADATAIGVLMLLVPGVAVTNAIRDTIAGDLVAGVARGADALMSAAAISVGAGAAYWAWRLAEGAAGAPSAAAAAVAAAAPWPAALWAGLATAGFALLFSARRRDLPLAALGGALGWAVAAPLRPLCGSEALACLAASAAIGVYAELVAALRRRPASIYIACGIIPLVPGGGMYYTMLDYVRGENWRSISTAFATLLTAGAIAVGLAVSSAASRILSLRRLGARLGPGP
jgi:uncharacterized membrane protein YjjP (DUF1212 family)